MWQNKISINQTNDQFVLGYSSVNFWHTYVALESWHCAESSVNSAICVEVSKFWFNVLCYSNAKPMGISDFNPGSFY